MPSRQQEISETLDLIESIWRQHPDLRLCQLIGNCFEPGDNYNREDKTLYQKLCETYNV